MNRMLAALALGVFIAAMVLIAISSVGSDDSSSSAATAATSRHVITRTRPTTNTPNPPARLTLAPLGPYDPPPGDGTENDSQVPLVLDGNPATFWSTEHYTHGFFKKGVGIVLDAGARKKITKVFVGTDAAGSKVEIQLGDNPNGPFRLVSKEQELSGTTTFALTSGATGRYILVWATAVQPSSGEAHISEVRALGS